MNKKLFCGLLFVMFAIFIFAGCGGGGGSSYITQNEIFVFWGGIMVRYIVNRFIVSDNLQFIGSLIWESMGK